VSIETRYQAAPERMVTRSRSPGIDSPWAWISERRVESVAVVEAADWSSSSAAASSAADVGAPLVTVVRSCPRVVAVMVTPPVRARTPSSARAMKATTSDATSLVAIATATDTAPPMAMAMAKEAAAVVALIDAVSRAVIVMAEAAIPGASGSAGAPSPSIHAPTWVPMRLTEVTPAPAPAPPYSPPAAAKEPAATTARITWFASAWMARAPPASTVVSSRNAWIRLGPWSTQRVVSA